MSDRSPSDVLAIRMLDAIDALPVPVGPGRLRARPRLTQLLRLDPIVIAILIVLVFAAVAATPVGRAAVTEAGRLIERILGLGPWPAYYGTLVTRPDGVRVEHLMFWDGTSAGRTVLTAPQTGWRGGWWSEDRSAIAVAAGPSIYIGDRSGVLREVANLDPLYVMTLNWVGSDRISATARDGDRQCAIGCTDWLIQVDTRSGDVSRMQLPEEARSARDVGLLGVLDAAAGPPARKFSPDGRWLVTTDRPCRSVAVYDLKSDRRIQLADGVRTQGIPLGWLRGSVLVWATCDASTQTLNVRAGVPDAVATEIGSIPLSSINESVGPALDQVRDRLLISGRSGDEWVISALDLDGHQTEVTRLRISLRSERGGIQPIDISRDGRLLAFSAVDWENTGYGTTLSAVIRSGLVDLQSGEITWACEKDCAKMRLR